MAKKHIEPKAAGHSKATHVKSAAAPSPADPLEGAAAAVKRVEGRALALAPSQLTSMNVDIVSGSNIVLGVAPRIVAYRDQMVALPGFDITHVDNLVDYANAAWFVAINNLPQPQPQQLQAMVVEATDLRTHFLTWAAPLVHAKKFDQGAIDTIKEGSGNKDLAGDVVALATLYRSNFAEVSPMCGVTMPEIERGEVLGKLLFAAIGTRDETIAPSLTDGSLRVRRFWTLLDVAYDQCQRAIAYLEWGVDDYSVIAPSLRRNSGTRSSSSVTKTPTTPTTPSNPTPTSPVATPTPAAPITTTAAPIGGNSSPFGNANK